VEGLFISVLNMSLTAGYVIAAVMLIRLFLKKAPKAISYALWAVAGLRLLIPFTFESILSLMPFRPQPISQAAALGENVPFVSSVGAALKAIGDAANGGLGTVTVYLGKTADGYPITTEAYHSQVWLNLGSYLWVIGTIALLIYSVVSVIMLRRRLQNAVLSEDNIYEADNLKTPFVLGIFKPRIFIPAGLADEEKGYIIRHEQTHIRRFDHIIKPFAFLILSIHWFNPLVWYAFAAMGNDMELSCDERVIREMGGEIKKAYSSSLLSLAAEKRILNGSPLAFAEGDVGVRIKHVLSYKKPAFWVSVVAVAAIFVLCIALLSDPLQKGTQLMGSEYRIEKLLYNTPLTPAADTEKLFCITADYTLYIQEAESDGWAYVGPLEAYPLTADELHGYCYDKSGWRSYKVRKIADAYIIRLDDGFFYFAVQTASGDTLLAHGWEDISERNQGDSDDTAIDSIFLLDSTFPEQGINIDFLDRSIAAYAGDSANCYSFFQSNDIPDFLIAGFIADGSSEKSNMGFATFRFKGGRYRLIDCRVYGNTAITTQPSGNPTIQNGVHLAENFAVYYNYGKPSEDVAYEIVLSNNPTLSSITRIVNGTRQSTEPVTDNPSMTVFRRAKTDAQYEVAYELTFDGTEKVILGDS